MLSSAFSQNLTKLPYSTSELREPENWALGIKSQQNVKISSRFTERSLESREAINPSDAAEGIPCPLSRPALWNMEREGVGRLLAGKGTGPDGG